MPGVQQELWEAKFSQNPEARKVLLLTQTAELWHSAPRAGKVRWTGLEVLRDELAKAKQNAPPPTTEMADAEEDTPVAPTPAAAKKTAKKTNAKAKKTTNAPVPEGNLTTGEVVEQPPEEVALPDMDAPERQETAVRFCPVCRYYMYLQVAGEDQSLYRQCKNCGHREDEEKGGLVMEMQVQERSAEGYRILLNEFTRQDPRLPHIRKNIKCPDPACKSNHGETEPDVIYIKYDAVNLRYLYICDVCGYQWRSGR
jgi:DNA-directed RNA polymerase subunit M/transcription elongation factor TFIIS